MKVTQLTDSVEINSVARELQGKGVRVAIDIETTGTNPRKDKLVMLQLATTKRGWWIDLRHQPPMSLLALRNVLAPLFDGNCLLVGHNIKFDLGFLLQQTGLTAQRVYDTQVAEQVITGLGMSEAKKFGTSFALKALAAKYGMGEMDKEVRSSFIDMDQTAAWDEPFSAELIEYGMRDVEVLHGIYNQQQELIQARDLTPTIYVDMNALLAQVGMEVFGVPVYVQGWREAIERTEAEAQQKETELLLEFGPHILAVRQAEFDAEWVVWEAWSKAKADYLHDLKALWGEKTGWGAYKQAAMAEWNAAHPQPKKPKMVKEPPNIGSSLQLQQALNHMKLFAPGSRQPLLFTSAAEKALQPYASNPTIEKLLEWRKQNKLVVAFGEKLLAGVESVDAEGIGRLYPSYHLIGAGTGRMSCFHPNFQQIPSRGAGAELRTHIRPVSGKKLVVCDFSNIELRILAEIANDKRLLEAFASGEDVHSVMARMIFNLPESINPKEELAQVNGKTLPATYRAIAKTVTYAVIYGSGPAKLASVIKGSVEDAKGIIEKYLNMFVGIRAFKDGQAQKVSNALNMGRRTVSSKTVGGRKRYYRLPTRPADVKRGASQADFDAYEEAMKKYRGLISGIRRKMVNSPIQGTSADITKWAMGEWFRKAEYDPKVKLIAVVHDEMLLEVDADFAEAAKEDLQEAMHDAMLVYLHKVSTPLPEAVISEYWTH